MKHEQLDNIPLLLRTRGPTFGGGILVSDACISLDPLCIDSRHDSALTQLYGLLASTLIEEDCDLRSEVRTLDVLAFNLIATVPLI